MARTQATRQLAVSTPKGDDVLLVRAVSFTDALSRLFEIDVHLLSEDPLIKYEDLLGKNVTVRLNVGEEKERYFNGFVSRFVQTGGGGGMAEYHATLVPWAWFLTRHADCRIFQNTSIPDIIKQIFRDRGFSDFEDKLSATYGEWEYCVQYRETDFNFISRLMEQEGIYYYFRHENGKHVLVLTDSASHHTAFPLYEEIEFRPPDAVMEDREFITSWSLQQQLQPAQFSHGDHDWSKASPILTATQKTTAKVSVGKSEVYDYPGEFEVGKDGEDLAKVRMQELESRYETASGASDSRGICVGRKFKLVNYRREDQCKEYLVTGAVMRAESDTMESGGETQTTVSVSFTAIPASQQFRPARATPRPLISGCQTAIVVGPSGKEVWTDEHGRVKVMFHWDREAAADDESSCWIRVAQHWAGKAWGTMMIPRVGQEVIVEFLEGDPDRPIIVGRVYNAVNKPPYKLPDQDTMSTIKSSSSPGGGGFNEIRFQDKAGEEQIFMHAQKDLDLRVLHDARQWYGNDRHAVVQNDTYEKVANDRHEIVAGNHKEKVSGNRGLTVEGNDNTHTMGNHSLTVDGDSGTKVSGSTHHDTAGDLFLTADSIILTAKTNITLNVGGASISIEDGSITVKSSNEAEVIAANTLKLEGSTTTLKGSGSVEASSDGTMKVSGAASTTVESSGVTTIKGSMVKVN